MPSDIILLASTPMESSSIRKTITVDHEKFHAGKTHIHGQLDDRTVSLVLTGLGTVNTAHALTCVLERRRPKLVLQFGVGGAYLSSGLDVGDIAVATEELYGDLGVQTPAGWASAELIGIPILEMQGEGKKFFNRFPLDDKLVAIAGELIQNMDWEDDPPVVKHGTFVTVQQCSGVTTLGNEIAARFNGICENMEGAAAAHLCTLYDIPFLEIRAISNRVEDRNMAAWNLPLSIERVQKTVQSVVKELRV